MRNDVETIPYGAQIAELEKIFRNVMKVICAKQGINYTYFKIIKPLAKHKEGIIQKEIVENANIKPSTVSLTLRNMELEGYIQRELCESDNRKVIVKITPLGEALDRQIKSCFETVEAMMIQGIEQVELNAFSTILSKMKQNLES
ncbi:MAG: MarR family transcriptional regulator [Prevotella sp.]|nr:MarR family transcriptional regulator [Staphylococcus sp.]MCM1349780.1 MarR family transcriptional regulator [Prevotella sp.]